MGNKHYEVLFTHWVACMVPFHGVLQERKQTLFLLWFWFWFVFFQKKILTSNSAATGFSTHFQLLVLLKY